MPPKHEDSLQPKPGDPGYCLLNHSILNSADIEKIVDEAPNAIEESITTEDSAPVPHLSELMADYQEGVADATEEFGNQFKTDYEETVGRIKENCDAIEKAATEKLLDLYKSKNIFTHDNTVTDSDFTPEELAKLKHFKNVLHNIEMYKNQDGLMNFVRSENIIKEVATNPEFLKREYIKFKSFKRVSQVQNSLNFDSAIKAAFNNVDSAEFKPFIAFCYCLLRYLNYLNKENKLASYLVYATFTSATTNASIYSPRPFYTMLFDELSTLKVDSKKSYEKRIPTVLPPSIPRKKKGAKKRNGKKRHK